MQLIGLVDPALALAQLAERRATVLDVYPSYFGELVEHGLRVGYRPADFRLERVIIGGEIVTAGLLARAERLFGAVEFIENYASTEMVPCGGTPCAQGHLHFEFSAGHHEVVALDGSGQAADGEPGSLVETPFPPYRETTLLLRYDTEDVVAPLSGPFGCEFAICRRPATSWASAASRYATTTAGSSSAGSWKPSRGATRYRCRPGTATGRRVGESRWRCWSATTTPVWGGPSATGWRPTAYRSRS